MDELQRKVFPDAAATSLGVRMFCDLNSELLKDTQLISFQSEILHLVVLMRPTLMPAKVFSRRQYR
jgi:hypothetical protein